MNNNIKKIFLITLSIICFVIFYEIYLRLSEIALPSFIYDDPKYGRTFKPNTDILFISAEGFYMGGVNSYGNIGKSYPKEKSADVLRIAIFGDSFIEGLQLFERNHFKSLVDKNLSKKLNQKVEILNFGIGGIDFSDAYFICKEKGLQYHPDIILFSVKKTNLRKKAGIPYPKYYMQNDSLKVSYTNLNSDMSELRRRFAVLRQFSIGYLLKESFENYKNGLLSKKVFEKFHTESIPDSIYKERISPDSPEKDIQYPVNKKILEELNLISVIGETKCILLITDDMPNYYYPLLDSLDSILKLNLPPALNDYYNKDFRYWKASGMYGHWNQKAHQVVSEFLTSEIVKFVNNEFKNITQSELLEDK